MMKAIVIALAVLTAVPSFAADDGKECQPKWYERLLPSWLRGAEKKPDADTGVGEDGLPKFKPRPPDKLAPMANYRKAVNEKKNHPTISTEGTTFSTHVNEDNQLPRGSAIITSSGKLAERGITAIIHAASGGGAGATGRPSEIGVELSVKNSLALAKTHGHKRVAIPFIGGQIFLHSIGIPAEKLAETIIRSTLESRGDLEIAFVLFSKGDKAAFEEALKVVANGKPTPKIDIVQGDITDYNVHHASAIVNAANMGVWFGGGVSGAIGDASGQRNEINGEAQKAMGAFNADLLKAVKKSPPK